MAQNGTTWTWTEGKLEAARLLAEGVQTDEAMADALGIGRRTLARWKLIPQFAAKVEELRKEIEAAVFSQGIASRANRIRALDERARLMRQVIAERAADPEMAAASGGKTGLLCRQVARVIKVHVPAVPPIPGVPGRAAHEVEVPVWEYAVDTGLLRELREHEKQAAQELGQWVQKVAPTTPDGKHESGAAALMGVIADYARYFGLAGPEGSEAQAGSASGDGAGEPLDPPAADAETS